MVVVPVYEREAEAIGYALSERGFACPGHTLGSGNIGVPRRSNARMKKVSGSVLICEVKEVICTMTITSFAAIRSPFLPPSRLEPRVIIVGAEPKIVTNGKPFYN